MAEPDETAGSEEADPVSRMQALLDEFKATKAESVEFKGKTIQDAEREAFVRVRAHTRARREQSKAPGA